MGESKATAKLSPIFSWSQTIIALLSPPIISTFLLNGTANKPSIFFADSLQSDFYL